MPKITLKNKGGDAVYKFNLPDPSTISDVYGYVIENFPLPAPFDPQMLILGLWDPHHTSFYPLAPHSEKPLVQFVHKGGGNEEISVYMLTASDVKDTLVLGGP